MSPQSTIGADAPRTLLLGAYGHGNSGDDVFLHAALRLFAKHMLCINSADDNLLPAGVADRVTTIATVGKRDILKKLVTLLRTDNFVYCGGDLWVELYGERRPRQQLYKMLLLNLVGRLLGKKVFYLGCGIGALHGYSLFLARMSARLAHGIITREERSARVLQLPTVSVLPDLAINLPFYRPRLHHMPRANQPFVVGISLLYYVPDPKTGFPNLLKVLCELAIHFPPHTVLKLLPMQTGEETVHNDVWASEQLQQVLSKNGFTATIEVVSDLASLVERFGDCHLVIGARLHAAILTTLNATPCLGIAYRPKVASFFADNNLGEYCVDIDALDQLPRVFSAMLANYAVAAERFYAASQMNLAEQPKYQHYVEMMTHANKDDDVYQDLSAEVE